MRARTLLLLVVALMLPAAAAAQVKPWIAVNGSWATYAMEDANDFVGMVNGELAGSGLSMKEINNGFGIGGAVGIDLPAGLGLGVAYDRLMASTDVGTVFASIEFKHPANAFRAFGEYKLPMQGPVGLHLGLSAGMISEAGEIKLEAVGETPMSIKLSGTGPLVEGYLGSTFWAAPQFGLGASAGYRYAKIGTVKAEAGGVTETMTNADDSNFTADYSGVFLRLGLKFAFSK